ncbi:MAG: hydroxymethylbilane synthase [Oligoflexales bacterium]|nr:hydroxymethylbilane synthase [Oligoflexales bacterium]
MKISDLKLPVPPQKEIVIATRGSALALWQAEYAQSLLASCGLLSRLLIVRSTGDRMQDRALHEIGGKGVFIKELEEVLAAGKADMALHCLKDMPAQVSERFALPCFMTRHPSADLLILSPDLASTLPPQLLAKSIWGKEELAALPALHIGTGSLRRKALLLQANKKFQVQGIRGNVDTRLNKMKAGEYQALVLAEASLYRLSLGEDLFQVRLDPHWFIPCSSQGVLVMETLQESPMKDWFRHLTCVRTERLVGIERRVLSLMGGDCTLPAGVHAAYETVDAKSHPYKDIRCEAVVLDPEGKEGLWSSLIVPDQEAELAADLLFQDLMRQGAAKFLNL